MSDPVTENKPENEEQKSNVQAEEEDTGGSFTPVVQLQEVQIKNEEEEEESLFKMRAKLFRFDKKENAWKERGLGDVKFLKHKETKKVRLLMRREKTLKVCMNHYGTDVLARKHNTLATRSLRFVICVLTALFNS
jgi:Ran-binding protein 1